MRLNFSTKTSKSTYDKLSAIEIDTDIYVDEICKI